VERVYGLARRLGLGLKLRFALVVGRFNTLDYLLELEMELLIPLWNSDSQEML
jgi:hypothetical protein